MAREISSILPYEVLPAKTSRPWSPAGRTQPYEASARHSTKRQSSSHQSGIANPVQEPILIIDWAPSTYGQYDFSAGAIGKNLQRCS